MQIAIIQNGCIANVVEVESMDVDGVAMTALEHARQLFHGEQIEELPDGAGIGWIYTDDATCLPPPGAEPQVARPRIVIVSIAADEAHSAGTLVDIERGEVTCIEGTRLAVTAELRLGAAVVPKSAQFRLPMRATDGRERVLLATMTDGVISISATLRDSGIWRVDEAGINSAMPAGGGFDFSGLTLYVLQD